MSLSLAGVGTCSELTLDLDWKVRGKLDMQEAVVGVTTVQLLCACVSPPICLEYKVYGNAINLSAQAQAIPAARIQAAKC